jgi:hypothetical protein
VKAAWKGDKEGDSDEAKGCPGLSLLQVIKHNIGSKLKMHWYLFFLHEGPWLCDEKKRRYVRKSSSMTFNESLFGRHPISLCFYYFLRKNKE